MLTNIPIAWVRGGTYQSKILADKRSSCPGQQTAGSTRSHDPAAHFAFTRKAAETQVHCC